MRQGAVVKAAATLARDTPSPARPVQSRVFFDALTFAGAVAMEVEQMSELRNSGVITAR